MVNVRQSHPLASDQGLVNPLLRLVSTIAAPVMVTSGSGQIIALNLECEQLTGYSASEVEGWDVWQLCRPSETSARIRQLVERGKFSNDQELLTDWLDRQGTPMQLLWSVRILPDPPSEMTYLIHTLRSLDPQIQHLQAALKTKEILLRELHHRVKNNLQVVASLLRLQYESLRSGKYRRIFQDAWSRIESMSLIHEEIYRWKTDPGCIDLAAYLNSLIDHLFNAYKVNTDRIDLEIQTEPIGLGIDAGITCGLIINELITNSLKYAFPNGRKGKIRVHFSQTDGSIVLVVGDDGIGLPPDFDLSQSPSLGLQLVTNLTEQLAGRIEFNRSQSTTFTITFPR